MRLTNFFRDLARAILILIAGVLTYGATMSSFTATEPGDPDPAHPALAANLAIASILVFLTGIILFYHGKKYWWLMMVLTLILSIVAITCLLPEAGA